ncbi:uncharacterized protein LOC115626633 [Scaptodrosophila lebanonensis]|uniref:Uncharacterized protein LOC115626633 n=1 Tax=Drosophila lebanonensis TaxID=7225 RepID=A0A6J2TSP1_DROLE|nr:uncharacterized protein LOC115626633 [Scaptodrosophila lebanonensis]
MDVDMLEDSVSSSPTAENTNDSIHSQRYRRRTRRKIFENHNRELRTQDIEAEEEDLCQADRLDCLRARHERQKQYPPASMQFVTAESQLQREHTESDDIALGLTNTELIILCNEVEQQTANIDTIEQTSESIVQTILDDFCSSPSDVQEDLTISFIYPYYRFRNKNTLTYSRTTRRRQDTTQEREDDRLSCSSELSVQEDYTSYVPTAAVLSNWDANSSQRICENLLNLSACLSEHGPNLDKSAHDSTSPFYETAQGSIYGTSRQDLPRGSSATNVQDRTLQDMISSGLPLVGDEKCKGDKEINKAFNMGHDDKSLIKQKAPPISLPHSSIKTNVIDEDVSNELNQKEWSDDDSSFFLHYNTQDPATKSIDSCNGKENQDVNALHVIDSLQSSLSSIANRVPDVKLQALTEIFCKKGSENETSKHHSKPVQHSKIPLNETIILDEFSHKNKGTDINENGVNIFDMTLSEWQLLPDLSEDTNAMSKEVPSYMKECKADATPHSPNQLKGIHLVNEHKNGLEYKRQVKDFRSTFEKINLVSEKTGKHGDIISDCQDMGGSRTSFSKAVPESDIMKYQQTDIPETMGFRTTSDKAIVVSDEALKHGAKIISDIIEYQQVDVPETIGFRTASDKAIVVSDKARKHGEKIISDVMECQQVDIPETMGFRTASDKAIVVSDEALKHGARIISDIIEYQQVDVPETMGFRTASDKAIVVSDKARKHGEKIISDVMECQQVDIPETMGFRTASDKAIVVSDDALKHGAKIISDIIECQKFDVPETIGFRTASDKAIVVSDKARKHAEKIISDVMECQQVDVLETMGFRTAADKPIVVSDKARKHGEQIISDIMECQQGDVSETMGIGSLYNKAILVSDKAQINADKVILEIKETVSGLNKSKLVEIPKLVELPAIEKERETDHDSMNSHSKLKLLYKTQKENDDVSNNHSESNVELQNTVNSNINLKRKLLDFNDTPTTPLNVKRMMQKSTSQNILETPRTMQQELSGQLAESTNMDNNTPNSIISRRNLSLTMRRKKRSSSTDVRKQTDTVLTPVRGCTEFSPVLTSTSTPLPSRKGNGSNGDENLVDTPKPKQGSEYLEVPSGSSSCTSAHKTRRLGLRFPRKYPN